MRFKAPRGTADVLPDEEPARAAVIRVAEEYARNYGYEAVVTPTFESTELFARTSGESSEVVQKEMYEFSDRGGRSLTLRPEGTASVARLYLENGLHTRPQPVKLYYVAPMFRYARTQRARLREFWQIGLEAIGSDDPMLDAELIVCFRRIVQRLKIKNVRLDINSIGDERCRPEYVELLRKFLKSRRADLDPESRLLTKTNPLRLFDNKDARIKAVMRDAPLITDSLCSECRDHFREVRSYLGSVGIRPRTNPMLVRGLDYYTRTVFEFHKPQLGAQSSICAGGRYDGLVEQLGGPPTPGVGWAAGIERMTLSLDANYLPLKPAVNVYFVIDDKVLRKHLFPYIQELRERWTCEVAYGARSHSKQFDLAVRRGASVIVVVDETGRLTARAYGDVRRFRSLPRLTKFLESVLGP